MTYIVLARRWRPMVFEDVIGQEHVTRTLVNALKNQRIAHAYIFAGPRGVGKTTTARLLAKVVNCEHQPATNPCNECPNCQSITNGSSMDVVEIDGASNRGIDEIRNLRENIRFAPASLKYKIYIIDEVHMLTKEAFNALLKTLEEPPAHAIFIFATTEIHRVPLTILSRCQRFDFKRISIEKIKSQLKKITESEGMKIPEEALLLIARKADGSMRDGESILDQLMSFGEKELTVEQVRDSLGLIDQETYFQFTDLLLEKDTAKILKYANRIIVSGHDLIDFLHGLQEHFRNFLVVRALGDSKMLDVSQYIRDRYQSLADKYAEKDLIHYLQIVTSAEQEFKFSSFPQLTLEMLLLKLAHKPASADLEEILAFIRKLKKIPPQINKQSAVGSPAPVKAASMKEEKIQKQPPVEKSPSVGIKYEPPKPSGGSIGEDFSQLKKKLAGLQDLPQSSPSHTVEKEKTGTTLDPDRIKEKWNLVVEKVMAEKIALGSFLQEGIPYAVEKNQLILAYDTHASFHREHVENQKKYVEGVLKDVLGFPMKVGFKSIDFEAEGIKKEPRTPEEILEDIKSKEPILNKIIETFGLEDLNKSNIH